MANRANGIQHRPEIDGLRTVAVVPVILFHAGSKTLSGGFIGVDVFFVISGYLITTIIHREKTAGHFSMARFWERRARRILPALYVVMFACIPFAAMLMLPHQHLEFARSLVAVGLFFSNTLFWWETDYFAAAAEQKPLLHTWSLSVEEQFYILFPPLMVAAWRLGSGRLTALIGTVALLSLGLSQYLAQSSPAANFYLLPTRAWELLFGSLCALWLIDRERSSHQWPAALGIIMILFSAVWFDEDTPFPSLWALLPVTGAVLVILFAQAGRGVGRILSLPLIAGIGLVSYSAYLWHQPLMAFARLAYAGAPPLWLMFVLAATSLPLAVLTWRFVEQPFRVPHGPFARRQQLAAVLLPALVTLVVIGAHGHITEGRGANWLALASPERVKTYELMQAARKEEPILNESGCVLSADRITPFLVSQLEGCSARFGPGLAIIGDSHGNELFQMITVARASTFVVNFSKGRCRPYSSKACPYNDVLELITNHRGLFSTAIYAQAGWQLLQDKFGAAGRDVFNRYGPDDALSLETIVVRDDYIKANIRYLLDLGRAVDVIWMMPKIEPMIDADSIVRKGCNSRFSLRKGHEELYRTIENRIFEYTRDKPIRTFSSIDAMDFDMVEDFATCNALFWRDWDHLSVAGRNVLGGRVVPKLMAFISKKTQSGH